MSNREFFVARARAELPAFRKVLAALPDGALAYKPHERSPSAEQLAFTLMAEAEACVEIIGKVRAEWKDVPPPPIAQMRERFGRAWETVADRAAALGEAGWSRQAQGVSDGQVVLEQAVGDFLWFILFDAIHHRGQLSAYLRPMGAKVPSIYGPSADDPGEM